MGVVARIGIVERDLHAAREVDLVLAGTDYDVRTKHLRLTWVKVADIDGHGSHLPREMDILNSVVFVPLARQLNCDIADGPWPVVGDVPKDLVRGRLRPQVGYRQVRLKWRSVGGLRLGYRYGH